MYDLRAIRENPAWFDAALKRRGLESLSSQVLEMDESRRSSQTQLGELQARRNAASKEIGAAMKDKDTARADALKAEVAEIKDKMTALEEAEAIAEGKLHQLLAGLPNRPDDSVPDGADEDDNEEEENEYEEEDEAAYVRASAPGKRAISRPESQSVLLTRTEMA